MELLRPDAHVRRQLQLTAKEYAADLLPLAIRRTASCPPGIRAHSLTDTNHCGTIPIVLSQVSTSWGHSVIGSFVRRSP